MPKSIMVKTQEEKSEQVVVPTLTQEERDQLMELRRRIELAREQRDSPRREFDDLTYLEDYQANQDAILTYLRPKMNDDEVRTNTATSEKKMETVKNELLSLNYKPEVRSFDKDNNEMVELGDDFTDIIFQTETQESAEDLDDEALTHLLGQRALFMEELFVEKEITDKRAVKRGEKNTKIKIERPEKRVLDGRQIYLGDITLPAHRFNDQPYIVKYERKLWIEAKAIYGHLEKWQYVKPGCSNDSDLFNYRLDKNLKDEEVEIVHYFSYPDDEYQILINSVPMFGVGEKLPWEYEGYNITMTVLKAIPGLSYGKSLIASAKTIQGLENETIRLMIRKMRQGIDPPLAFSSTGKLPSADMFAPGSRTMGLKPDGFARLVDHQGVNQSEFNMFNLITKITGEFIGASDVAQGMESSGNQTATEVRTLQRNFVKQLGHAVLAWKRVKRDMAKLRILNVLENFSAPIGKIKDERTGKIVKTYRRFSVNDGSIGGGNRGQKIIQFLDRDLEEDEISAIYRKEREMEKMGKKFRFRTINIDKLRKIFVNWYVVVNPKEQEGSDMDKVLFTDKLNQAIALSNATQTPLNVDKWTEGFERTYNDKDLFMKQKSPSDNPQMQAMMNDFNNQLELVEGSDQASQMKPSAEQKPSINSLENAQ